MATKQYPIVRAKVYDIYLPEIDDSEEMILVSFKDKEGQWYNTILWWKDIKDIMWPKMIETAFDEEELLESRGYFNEKYELKFKR